MHFNNKLAVDINLLQITASMYHLVHELFVSDGTHFYSCLAMISYIFEMMFPFRPHTWSCEVKFYKRKST